MTVHKPIFIAEVYAPKSIDPTESSLLTPVAGATHTDPFRIATANIGGFKPYMQIPAGRRGKVDIKTKVTDIGSLTLTALDPRVAPGTDNRVRWLTAFLGDGKGIDRILKCKVVVQRSLDGGIVFEPYFTGRIKDARQKEILEFVLLLDDVMKEADMTLFASPPHATVTYASSTPILPLSLRKKWLGFPQGLPLKAQVRTPAQGYSRYANFDFRSKWNNQVGILTEGIRDLASKIKAAATGFNLLQRRELTFPIGRVRAEVKNLSTNVTGWFDVPYIVFYKNVDNHWTIGNFAAEPLAGGMSWPSAGTNLEVWFYAQVFPTDSAALLIDKIPLVTLLRDICAGKFSPLNTDGTVQWAIPIDEESFDALEDDPDLPKVAFIINERDEFKKWVPENLLQPFQLALDPTPDGKLRLVDMRLNKQLVDLDPEAEGDVITELDLKSANEGEGWRSMSDDAINRIEAWYYRATQREQISPAIDKSEFPQVPPGRIDVVPQPVIPLYIAPRSLDFGSKSSFKLDLKGILANGDNDIFVTLAKDSWDDLAAINIAERLSDELQGPFQAGAQYLETTARVTDKTELIKPGTRKIVKVKTIPDPYTKERGQPQYAICLDRQESDLTTKFTWLSLGPLGLTEPPELGTLALKVDDPHHSATVEVTLNADGEPVVLEYALTPADDTVSPEFGWVRSQVATTTGTYTLGRFPSNMNLWVRGYSSPRLINIKKPDSVAVFPTPDHVLLTPYNAPTSLTYDGNTGNQLFFTIGLGETDLRTQVLMAIGESAYADWDETNIIETLEPGTTKFSVFQDLPTGTHSFGVRHMDNFGGVTEITQIDVAWVNTVIQAPRPAGFDFVPGSSIMLMLFTSDPTYYWIIDRTTDSGGSPNLGTVVRIVDETAGLLSSATLFLDPVAPDGTTYWYQVYLWKEGFDLSDPIPWKSFTPNSASGLGLDPNFDLIATPVEPTFNLVASQTETVGTLTVSVNDPQQRLVKIEFKHKSGFAGVETAYVQDSVIPYQDTVALILGETSTITVRFSYYQADGTLRMVEQTKSYSRSNVPGVLDAEYLVAAAHATLTNERVVEDTDTISWDFSAPGFAEATVIDDSITDQYLSATGVVAGTYGTGSLIPQITITSKGRITAVTEVEAIAESDPGSAVGRPGNLGPFHFVVRSGGTYVLGELGEDPEWLTDTGHFKLTTTYATHVTWWAHVAVADAGYLDIEYSVNGGASWAGVLGINQSLTVTGAKTGSIALDSGAIGENVIFRAVGGGGEDGSPEIYNFAFAFTVAEPEDLVISIPLTDLCYDHFADNITGVTDGDQFSPWLDATANNNDAANATLAQCPLYRATGSLNGSPCVETTASNQRLLHNHGFDALLGWDGSFEMYFVGQITAGEGSSSIAFGNGSLIDGKQHNGNMNICVTVRADGKVTFGITWNGGDTIMTPTSYIDGQMHVLCFWRDGTTGELRIYDETKALVASGMCTAGASPLGGYLFIGNDNVTLDPHSSRAKYRRSLGYRGNHSDPDRDDIIDSLVALIL